MCKREEGRNKEVGRFSMASRHCSNNWGVPYHGPTRLYGSGAAALGLTIALWYIHKPLGHGMVRPSRAMDMLHSYMEPGGCWDV